MAAALLIGASVVYSNQTHQMASIGTQSVVDQVTRGAALLLDVRTDAEWAAGHAAPAVHFDLARLQNGELPSVPKNTPIYVYCRTGHRAGEAQTILSRAGYTNVTNIGGLSDWQAMGGAVAVE